MVFFFQAYSTGPMVVSFCRVVFACTLCVAVCCAAVSAGEVKVENSVSADGAAGGVMDIEKISDKVTELLEMARVLESAVGVNQMGDEAALANKAKEAVLVATWVGDAAEQMLEAHKNAGLPQSAHRAAELADAAHVVHVAASAVRINAEKVASAMAAAKHSETAKSASAVALSNATKLLNDVTLSDGLKNIREDGKRAQALLDLANKADDIVTIARNMEKEARVAKEGADKAAAALGVEKVSAASDNATKLLEDVEAVINQTMRVKEMKEKVQQQRNTTDLRNAVKKMQKLSEKLNMVAMAAKESHIAAQEEAKEVEEAARDAIATRAAEVVDTTKEVTQMVEVTRRVLANELVAKKLKENMEEIGDNELLELEKELGFVDGSTPPYFNFIVCFVFFKFFSFYFFLSCIFFFFLLHYKICYKQFILFKRIFFFFDVK